MTPKLTQQEIQAMMDSSPMVRFMGLRIDAIDAEKGVVSFTMPLRPELERMPGTGQFHGGALSSFIDTAGDFAVAAQLGGIVPTINIRVDYLRPATGTLRAAACVRRLGRTVAVVDIDVTDSEGRLVAVGRGTYGAQVG